MPTASLFNLQNVYWSPNGQPVLADISFDLPEGQVIGIIGPNGAGKTSLLKLLSGHSKATDGRVIFKNRDLQKLPIIERAKEIAFAAQHPDFTFSLTVFDVVLAGRLPHRKWFSGSRAEKQSVMAALTKFQLEEKANQSFNTLSGGEQQRAFLARAIVQEASTLLLDEPTNHLDIHYQLQLMQDLKAFPGNVIMTLHDLNFAANYCDHVILLDQGNVVATGNPNEVMTKERIERIYKVIVDISDSGGKNITLRYCLAEQHNAKGHL